MLISLVSYWDRNEQNDLKCGRQRLERMVLALPSNQIAINNRHTTMQSFSIWMRMTLQRKATSSIRHAKKMKRLSGLPHPYLMFYVHIRFVLLYKLSISLFSLQAFGKFLVSKNRVILEFDRTLICWELICQDFPLVVLNRISIVSSHLWCTLRGSILNLKEEQPILVH